MLYFNFKNYEEFKSVFGMRKTNEGRYVRMEKVVLNVLKDMFRNKQNDPERWDKFFFTKTVKQPMSQNDLIRAGKHINGGDYTNRLMDGIYNLSSSVYRVDSDGLCYDGDVKSVRYEKDGHIYKMKASKFFGKVWTEHGYDQFYGEKAGIYCGEKFAEAWTAYAESKVGKDLYTLHVGNELKDFETIYSSSHDCGSCMRNKDQYYFYYNAVDASAAWLEDKEGYLVCRCVIFNKCEQRSTGKVMRLAERQYSTVDDKLKNILVQRLYAEGLIDAHKRVGAGCYDHDDFVDRNGDELSDCEFSINCHLEYGDTLSFQDSFAYFNHSEQIAYNYSGDYYTDELSVTDEVFGDEGEWDEWAGEMYHNENMEHAYWWNSRGRREGGYVAECNIYEYFVLCDCGEYRNEYVHHDFVVHIDGYDWCIHDEDIVEIDGEWYVKGDGCESCEDIEGYAADYIEWDGYYYANYTYSELLEKNVPDYLFDEVEEDYADAHGYTKDEYGEWFIEEDLETA